MKVRVLTANMVASGYAKFKNPNEKKESHKETEVSDIFTKFDFHNFLVKIP